MGFKRKVIRKGRWAGTWEFRHYLGLDPVPDEDGKRHKRHATTIWPAKDERDPKNPPGERAAEKALVRWVAKLEEKGEKPGSRASVQYAVEKHLEMLEKLGRSPTTLQGYRSIKKTWIDPQIGSTAIEDLKPADVRRVHAEMTKAGRSSSRIRQMHAVLQGALGLTIEEEWLDRNVAMMIKRPKQERADIYCPTSEEVDKLFREAGGDKKALGAAIGLGATLGRRLGELCGIRLSDIDFDAMTMIEINGKQVAVPGTVRIEDSAYAVAGQPAAEKDTKTHNKVTIFAGEVALERIRRRLLAMQKRATKVGVELVKDPYLLSTKSDGSGPPRPDTYTKAMTKLRDRLEMPEVHFHSLRHFVATYLLDQGVDVVIIAQRLGWADASMLPRSTPTTSARKRRPLPQQRSTEG